jgi:AcrR family transcriptional regulator
MLYRSWGQEELGYDNTARAARARSTRGRILEAAAASFRAQGYGATTIRGVAGAAGVSPESVYKGFRNKATLLKAVYDRTLAGDDEPAGIPDRPGARAVAAATTPAGSAWAYARMAAEISAHIGPLLRLVYGAQGTDPDLAEFVRTTDTERLTGAGMVVAHWNRQGWLRPDLGEPAARDILWALNSPYTYLQLADRGWTDDAYVEWLATTLTATLLT